MVTTAADALKPPTQHLLRQAAPVTFRARMPVVTSQQASPQVHIFVNVFTFTDLKYQSINIIRQTSCARCHHCPPFPPAICAIWSMNREKTIIDFWNLISKFINYRSRSAATATTAAVAGGCRGCGIAVSAASLCADHDDGVRISGGIADVRHTCPV